MAWDNFLSAVAGSSSPNTVAYFRRIEEFGLFNIKQSGESRSLYLRFANNQKMSLETKDGRAFLHQSLLSLARVNEYISTGIPSVFSHLDQCAPEVQIPCVEILLDLISSIPETDAPAIVRNARHILSGSPNVRAVYAAQSNSP